MPDASLIPPSAAAILLTVDSSRSAESVDWSTCRLYSRWALDMRSVLATTCFRVWFISFIPWTATYRDNSPISRTESFTAETLWFTRPIPCRRSSVEDIPASRITWSSCPIFPAAASPWAIKREKLALNWSASTSSSRISPIFHYLQSLPLCFPGCPLHHGKHQQFFPLCTFLKLFGKDTKRDKGKTGGLCLPVLPV